MSEAEETPRPLFLQIVRGNPTDEQIAALSAVLAAAADAGADEQAKPATKGAWAHPERAVRTAYQHGHGGWRASASPR